VNVLKSHKQNAVTTLLAHGVSQHEISRKTGIDRKTIRTYARAAAAQGDASNSSMATGFLEDLGQTGPPRPPARKAATTLGQIIAAFGDSNSPMATGFSEGRGQTPPPRSEALRGSAARSACEGHREWIQAQVRLGRNAMAIYQEMVDARGFTAAYNSVKRFCGGLRRREPEQFDRLEFAAGEECQVDYGEGAPTLDPRTGRYRKPRLFVMTLRFSRRSFRKVVWKSSSETWARLHEEAFRYFTGCPRYVVLDNLLEGVIKPDLYEPELNGLYSAVLEHYGVVADPARVRDPDRKGTVENAIQHTQSTALKGRYFDTLEAQNAHLKHWEEKWAALRIHGRAKRQVEEMFQEERPFLKPLPLEGFRYFEEAIRTVGDDTTIQVKGSWYAARPARIGTQVLVRIYTHDFEIRDLKTLALLRRHARTARAGEVVLPEAERVFNPSRQTHRILQLAEAIGPMTLALCRALFTQQGRQVQKSLWGIVNLVPRYPVSIIEQAAATAAAHRVHSTKGVRAIADRYLADALAQLDLRPVMPALTQQHALIRQTADYADFFSQHVRRESLAPTQETDP